MKKFIVGLALLSSLAWGAAKIQDADIKANANIADTKLATISTAGKVSNSATTATSANTASAIVARDSNGDISVRNISATTITAAITGNASTATALAANPADCGAGAKAISIAANGDLTCSAVSLTADVSGTLPVANGGTGAATFTANGVLFGNTTSPLGVTAAGTNGTVLKGVTSGSPTFGAVTLTTDVTGVLPLANGGTNKNMTAVNGGLVYTDADSQEVGSAGTSGQAAISGGAGAPTWFAPTLGSVVFAGASGILAQDNSNYFWDDTNNRLGIGTTAPTSRAHLNNSSAAVEYLQVTNSASGALVTDGMFFGLAADGTSGEVRNKETGAINFYTTNALRNSITSGGQTLFGSTSVTALTVDGAIPTIQAKSNGSGASIVINRTTANTSSPSLFFAKSRSGAIDSQGAVLNGDSLGIIEITPDNGTDYSNPAARITFLAEDSASAGIVNSAIAFFTANSAASVTERMRLSAAGLLGLGVSGNALSNRLTVIPPNAASTPASTTTPSEQIMLQSDNQAIVSGEMIGGIAFRSNDTSLTSPGLDVAYFVAIAEATHTTSDVTTGFAFYTTNALVTAEAMRISGAGDVGIGVTAPASRLDVSGGFALRATTDSTSSGTVNALANFMTSHIRLTASTTMTLNGVASSTAEKFLILTNLTGNTLTINDQSASAVATNRVVTGTGAAITVANNASVELKRDTTTAVWRVLGNYASGAATNYFQAVDTNNYRVVGAVINPPSAGSCAVSAEVGGDWINGTPTSGGTGLCAIPINASVFAAAPICTCSADNSGDFTCSIDGTSTSNINTNTYSTVASNQALFITCFGAR